MARNSLRATFVALLFTLGLVTGMVPLSETAWAQTTTFAYVVNSGSSSVSVINTSTDAVTATIPVGSSPFRIAFTNDGAKAYVTNLGSGTVSVINTATNSVTATVPVGTSPGGLAVSPDGAKVYVANTGSGTVSIIDTATDAAAGSFAVAPSGGSPIGIAFSPDGTHFLVSGGCGNCIQKYAYPSNNHLATITGIVGGGERISFFDNTTAFVVNGCGECGNLQKVSTVSNSVEATLALGGSGEGLAFPPDKSSVFVGRNHAYQLQRIDPASVTVTGSLNMASDINGLAFVSSSRLYAAEQNLNHVLVIDPSGPTVSGGPISVGSGPVDIQVVTLQAQDPYNFSGFFPPVDNPPVLNAVNAGRAIPVKFSLGGDQGLDVIASGYPKSQSISCSSTAPVDGIEQTVTAGGSSLSYDAATDRYTYVWKTDRSWAKTCRQFVLKLNDGTTHLANFKFS